MTGARVGSRPDVVQSVRPGGGSSSANTSQVQPSVEELDPRPRGPLSVRARPVAAPVRFRCPDFAQLAAGSRAGSYPPATSSGGSRYEFGGSASSASPPPVRHEPISASAAARGSPRQLPPIVYRSANEALRGSHLPAAWFTERACLHVQEDRCGGVVDAPGSPSAAAGRGIQPLPPPAPATVPPAAPPSPRAAPTPGKSIQHFDPPLQARSQYEAQVAPGGKLQLQWRPCEVLSYDPVEQRYRIRWSFGNQLEKYVSAVQLVLDGEPDRDAERRHAEARRRRDAAEGRLVEQLVVEELSKWDGAAPDVDVPALLAAAAVVADSSDKSSSADGAGGGGEGGDGNGPGGGGNSLVRIFRSVQPQSYEAEEEVLADLVREVWQNYQRAQAKSALRWNRAVVRSGGSSPLPGGGGSEGRRRRRSRAASLAGGGSGEEFVAGDGGEANMDDEEEVVELLSMLGTTSRSSPLLEALRTTGSQQERSASMASRIQHLSHRALFGHAATRDCLASAFSLCGDLSTAKVGDASTGGVVRQPDSLFLVRRRLEPYALEQISRALEDSQASFFLAYRTTWPEKITQVFLNAPKVQWCERISGLIARWMQVSLHGLLLHSLQGLVDMFRHYATLAQSIQAQTLSLTYVPPPPYQRNNSCDYELQPLFRIHVCVDFAAADFEPSGELAVEAFFASGDTKAISSISCRECHEAVAAHVRKRHKTELVAGYGFPDGGPEGGAVSAARVAIDLNTADYAQTLIATLAPSFEVVAPPRTPSPEAVLDEDADTPSQPRNEDANLEVTARRTSSTSTVLFEEQGLRVRLSAHPRSFRDVLGRHFRKVVELADNLSPIDSYLAIDGEAMMPGTLKGLLEVHAAQVEALQADFQQQVTQCFFDAPAVVWEVGKYRHLMLRFIGQFTQISSMLEPPPPPPQPPTPPSASSSRAGSSPSADADDVAGAKGADEEAATAESEPNAPGVATVEGIAFGVEELEAHLRALDAIYIELKDEPQLSERHLGLFVVDVAPLRRALLVMCQCCRLRLLGCTQRRLEDDCTTLLRSLQSKHAEIVMQPRTADELQSTLEAVNSLEDFLQEKQPQLDHIQEHFDLLRRWSHEVSDRLAHRWYDCVYQVPDLRDRAEKWRSLFQRELRARFNQKIAEHAKSLEEQCQECKRQLDDLASKVALNKAEFFHSKMKQLQVRMRGIQDEVEKQHSHEGMMHMPLTEFPWLTSMVSAIVPLLELWFLAHEWIQWKDEVLYGEFHRIDPESVKAKLASCTESIRRLEEVFASQPRPRQVLHSLSLELTELRVLLPVIVSLRNPGLRERHWQMIGEAIDQNIQMAQMRDISLHAMNERYPFVAHLAKIQAISDTAGREMLVEDELEKMQQQWQQLTIRIESLKPTGAQQTPSQADADHAEEEEEEEAIYKADFRHEEVWDLIAEQMAKVKVMVQSPDAAVHSAQLVKHDDRLKLIGELCDLLHEAQQSYLQAREQLVSDSIVYGLLQREGPGNREWRRLADVDNHWQQIMTMLLPQPSWLALLEVSRLLESCREAVVLMDRVLRVVRDVLDGCRRRVPLLYRLNDTELLQLLHKGSDPSLPEVCQCLGPHVHSLLVGQDDPRGGNNGSRRRVVHGVVGECGDYVPLATELQVAESDPPDQWLAALLEATGESLQGIFVSVANSSTPRLNAQVLLQEQIPMQLRSLVVDIRFTMDTEAMLENAGPRLQSLLERKSRQSTFLIRQIHRRQWVAAAVVEDEEEEDHATLPFSEAASLAASDDGGKGDELSGAEEDQDELRRNNRRSLDSSWSFARTPPMAPPSPPAATVERLGSLQTSRAAALAALSPSEDTEAMGFRHRGLAAALVVQTLLKWRDTLENLVAGISAGRRGTTSFEWMAVPRHYCEVAQPQMLRRASSRKSEHRVSHRQSTGGGGGGVSPVPPPSPRGKRRTSLRGSMVVPGSPGGGTSLRCTVRHAEAELPYAWHYIGAGGEALLGPTTGPAMLALSNAFASCQGLSLTGSGGGAVVTGLAQALGIAEERCLLRWDATTDILLRHIRGAVLAGVWLTVAVDSTANLQILATLAQELLAMLEAKRQSAIPDPDEAPPQTASSPRGGGTPAAASATPRGGSKVPPPSPSSSRTTRPTLVNLSAASRPATTWIDAVTATSFVTLRLLPRGSRSSNATDHVPQQLLEAFRPFAVPRPSLRALCELWLLSAGFAGLLARRLAPLAASLWQHTEEQGGAAVWLQQAQPEGGAAEAPQRGGAGAVGLRHLHLICCLTVRLAAGCRLHASGGLARQRSTGSASGGPGDAVRLEHVEPPLWARVALLWAFQQIFCGRFGYEHSGDLLEAPARMRELLHVADDDCKAFPPEVFEVEGVGGLRAKVSTAFEDLHLLPLERQVGAAFQLHLALRPPSVRQPRCEADALGEAEGGASADGAAEASAAAESKGTANATATAFATTAAAPASDEWALAVRGALLLGAPASGKSSCVHALQETLERQDQEAWELRHLSAASLALDAADALQRPAAAADGAAARLVPTTTDAGLLAGWYRGSAEGGKEAARESGERHVLVHVDGELGPHEAGAFVGALAGSPPVGGAAPWPGLCLSGQSWLSARRGTLGIVFELDKKSVASLGPDLVSRCATVYLKSDEEEGAVGERSAVIAGWVEELRHDEGEVLARLVDDLCRALLEPLLLLLQGAVEPGDAPEARSTGAGSEAHSHRRNAEVFTPARSTASAIDRARLANASSTKLPAKWRDKVVGELTNLAGQWATPPGPPSRIAELHVKGAFLALFRSWQDRLATEHASLAMFNQLSQATLQGKKRLSKTALMKDIPDAKDQSAGSTREATVAFIFAVAWALAPLVAREAHALLEEALHRLLELYGKCEVRVPTEYSILDAVPVENLSHLQHIDWILPPVEKADIDAYVYVPAADARRFLSLATVLSRSQTNMTLLGPAGCGKTGALAAFFSKLPVRSAPPALPSCYAIHGPAGTRPKGGLGSDVELRYLSVGPWTAIGKWERLLLKPLVKSSRNSIRPPLGVWCLCVVDDCHCGPPALGEAWRFLLEHGLVHTPGAAGSISSGTGGASGTAARRAERHEREPPAPTIRRLEGVMMLLAARTGTPFCKQLSLLRHTWLYAMDRPSEAELGAIVGDNMSHFVYVNDLPTVISSRKALYVRLVHAWMLKLREKREASALLTPHILFRFFKSLLCLPTEWLCDLSPPAFHALLLHELIRETVDRLTAPGDQAAALKDLAALHLEIFGTAGLEKEGGGTDGADRQSGEAPTPRGDARHEVGTVDGMAKSLGALHFSALTITNPQAGQYHGFVEDGREHSNVTHVFDQLKDHINRELVSRWPRHDYVPPLVRSLNPDLPPQARSFSRPFFTEPEEASSLEPQQLLMYRDFCHHLLSLSRLLFRTTSGLGRDHVWGNAGGKTLVCSPMVSLALGPLRALAHLRGVGIDILEGPESLAENQAKHSEELTITPDALRSWVKGRFLLAVAEHIDIILCVTPTVLDRPELVGVLHEVFAYEGPPEDWYSERERRECESVVGGYSRLARNSIYASRSSIAFAGKGVVDDDGVPMPSAFEQFWNEALSLTHFVLLAETSRPGDLLSSSSRFGVDVLDQHGPAILQQLAVIQIEPLQVEGIVDVATFYVESPVLKLESWQPELAKTDEPQNVRRVAEVAARLFHAGLESKASLPCHATEAGSGPLGASARLLSPRAAAVTEPSTRPAGGTEAEAGSLPMAAGVSQWPPLEGVQPGKVVDQPLSQVLELLTLAQSLCKLKGRALQIKHDVLQNALAVLEMGHGLLDGDGGEAERRGDVAAEAWKTSADELEQKQKTHDDHHRQLAQLTEEVVVRLRDATAKHDAMEALRVQSLKDLVHSRGQLRGIGKSEQAELRSLAKLHTAAAATIAAAAAAAGGEAASAYRLFEFCCVAMKGIEHPSRDEVRATMTDTGFASKLAGLEPEGLTLEQVHVMEDMVQHIDRGEFSEVRPLLLVSNVVFPVFMIAAMSQRLPKAQAEVESLREVKEARAEELKDMQARATELEHELEEALREEQRLRKEKQSAEERKKSTNDRTGRARSLMNVAAAERARWQAELEQLREKLRCLVGDCLLSAAAAFYFGPYDATQRAQLMVQWKQLLQGSGMRHSEPWDLGEYWLPVTSRHQWHLEHRLPADRHLSESMIIAMLQSSTWPLLYDPDGIAADFIMLIFPGSHRLSVGALNFREKFLAAIGPDEGARLNEHKLIIVEVENLKEIREEPELMELLPRQRMHFGGSVVYHSGGEEATHVGPNLMLVFVTKAIELAARDTVGTKLGIVDFHSAGGGGLLQDLFADLLPDHAHCPPTYVDLLLMLHERANAFADWHLTDAALAKKLAEQVADGTVAPAFFQTDEHVGAFVSLKDELTKIERRLHKNRDTDTARPE